MRWRGVEPRACAWKAPELGMLDGDWARELIGGSLQMLPLHHQRGIIELSAFPGLMYD